MVTSTNALSNQVNRDLSQARPQEKRVDAERKDIPDFGTMIAESNIAFQKEMEAKKSEMGEDGELRIGESKDDKAFREMLEKVTGKKEKRLKNKLEKDDFLNLMVTQLKYQDPTKPADHKDMAQQLAQFNSVEQLVSANKSLEQIAKSQDELKADKLTEYLGKEVTVKGNSLHFDGSSLKTKASFDLPSAAGSASVIIKDGEGEVVRSLSLGALPQGEQQVSWDGKDKNGELAKAGRYTFEVVATSTDGKPLKTETQFTSRVTGVGQLNKGGQLETILGAIKSKDILAVREQGAEVPPPIKETAATKPSTVAPPPQKEVTRNESQTVNQQPVQQPVAQNKRV